jgi:hypothetical protein
MGDSVHEIARELIVILLKGLFGLFMLVALILLGSTISVMLKTPSRLHENADEEWSTRLKSIVTPPPGLLRE